MAESVEAQWLRTHWDTEYLGRYQNHWIAVLNEEVIAEGETLEKVMEQVELCIKPLYAFVHLERLQ